MRIMQKEKAERLLSLHHTKQILILPNVWDPLGARILETAGFPAAATASAAISASQGFEDGEQIKLSDHLEIIKKIVGSTIIPVTADIEGGYADNNDDLEKSIKLILDTGAAGINIEDSIKEKHLRTVDEQSERISLIKKISEDAGIPLVINARTDYVLINPHASEKELMINLLERSEKYFNAGASCFYPVGLSDLNIIKKLRKEISGPINILGSAVSPSITQLQDAGINRVSFGPFVFRSVMKKFINIIGELHALGDNSIFSEDMMSKKEIEKYLRNSLSAY